MDTVTLVYAAIVLVAGIVIFAASFLQKKDERKKFINGKAQSYAFIVIVGMLLIEVGQAIFFTVQGNSTSIGDGISPLMFLTVISIIYLLTILVYRNKYGG
ncbi:hypothetical protein ACFO0S_01940 [Chryseomicrobium palamuruense]|uniref:Integral membrane protein n=1 Tax=Chryseomicrobium palamuruense TaxID=682973 RepID=A0ABV8URA4_9BACL